MISNSGQAIAKLDSIDKWPNSDGYLEVQDGNSIIGRFDVQVKQIKSENLSFPFKIDFLNYCMQSTTSPILAIFADIDNSRVYWLHLSRKLLMESEYWNNTGTKSFRIDPNNEITCESLKYITQWKKILNEHKQKLHDYDRLDKELKTILENSNELIGKSDKNFENIHKFLDKFNSLLDNEYSIIKRMIYPNLWKMGYAYQHYNENSVLYTLYPISNNKNDLQIKKLDEKLKIFGYRWKNYGNPFHENPEKSAYSEIKEIIMKMIKNHRLDNCFSEYILNEYIFAYADRFCIPSGLNSKDTYALSEIKDSFQKYLPLWIDNAVECLITSERENFKKREDCLFFNINSEYYDPELLVNELNEEELNEISKKTMKDIINKKIPDLPRGNGKISFYVFDKLLNWAESLNISKFNRIYKKIESENSDFDKNIEYNLRVFFENIPKVYGEIIDANFPKLKDEISRFSAKNILVVLDIHRDNPRFFMYFSEPLDGFYDPKIRIIHRRDYSEFKEIEFIKPVVFDDKDFYLFKMNDTKFIFEYLPMFNYVYAELSWKFEKYFKENNVGYEYFKPKYDFTPDQ